MNYDNIPKHLKDKAKWCCWKYEKKENNDKLAKIPKNPITGFNASVNKEATFTSFDEVIKYANNYDGIGIRVSDFIIAGDIDNCIKDGKLNNLASSVLSKFPSTYFEYSPSGKGLRFFLKLPKTFNYDIKNYKMKNGKLEVYVAGQTNRFVTVAGNVYQDGDITEDENSLKWLLDTYLKRNNTQDDSNKILEHKSYLSDEEVIKKASSAVNTDKFNALYYAGDISAYKSHSEADIALSSILAFYCGGDYEQIDRLFRTSAMYMDKWNEMRGSDTYGNITIKNAVKSLNKFYEPIKTVSADIDFNDELSRLKSLNYPLENSLYPWTDIGASKLFADFYKDILRYVPERKSWFYYENGIWSKDTANLKAMKLCMDLASFVHICALDIKDEDKRKSFMIHSKKWQSHGYRVNILKDAQVHHPIRVFNFDSNPYIFNCKNGTYNLATGEFSEHKSSDLLTKISNVNYKPSLSSDRWDEFIKEIMSFDDEKIKFLKKIFGYGLSGDTRHECMSILYGASTRNGKGTLCESVLKVLGTYACTARAETIALNRNTNSSSPSEDIARLAGVRFVNISEPGKGLVLNVAQVKSMTGNDTLNARFLHENSFDFKPSFKLYINTNYLPSINDMTIFTSGRVLIIPFERHFKEYEQDKNLKREFAKDAVQSAILNWLIEGFNLLKKEGLLVPKVIKDATNKYQHDSDKISLFIEDCLERGNYEVRSSEVYFRYKQWCLENGHYAENMKNFKQCLASKVNFVRKRPQGGGEKTTIITGYKLLSEFL